ncbi:ribonuclease H-like domain-containing protein [Tanacetum coccineum]|uniref:Ribonuclease H-like domain-containing protein n=1 Tax=Tanacetum coccineum TaxID=301880 RepID=A0ABQ5FXG4_9ASTR
MESPPYFAPPHHHDSSRPTIGFPLGTALLLIVVFSLSGIFSCCYHWDKLRHLRGDFSDDDNHGSDDSDSKPKPVYSEKNQEEDKSVPVIMAGDQYARFIAMPCPSEPPRQGKIVVEECELMAYGEFSRKDYQNRTTFVSRCVVRGTFTRSLNNLRLKLQLFCFHLVSTTWHRRLGHPGDDVLRRLESKNLISCRKSKLSVFLVSLLSISKKHAKLPFYNSESSVNSVFEIIHSDIWTSPIPSESGIKYYAIFLDHFSHFVWVYPLHKKADLFDNFVAFRAYVNKHFNVDIKALQCDIGGEYDNTRFHELFRQNGIQFWFSCPRTSQQNGKSERMLRTVNNLIRTLLFQAHMPSSYWVKALNMAAHLLNILPFTAINNEIPFIKLYNQTPTYEHLRVFGCLCYPHVDVSHKLEPRFTPCIFLGYLANHRGYWYGSLSRYKARLVANGRSQQQGIDCDETFSPVVKPATIRTVLSLVVSREWPIHQLDVKNAFLHGHLTETHSKTDTSLFVFHRGPDVAYLLLYVDDIILTAYSTTFLQRIISLLHGEFAMTDLGSLNYFFGVSAQRTASGMFLSQSKFAVEILERENMQKCNQCKTLVDTESKLGPDGEPVCLYMHDPRDPHFTALKRILRYVRGTIDHGLQLHVSSTAQLTAYTDADWAGCPVTRRSTSGYCVFLGDNLLSWSAKRHVTLSRSSAEAEYRGVANVVAETAWLRNLLLELHAPLSTAIIVRVLHVPSRYQYADIFTKGLPSALFLEFRSSLNVRRSPVHTEGEY